MLAGRECTVSIDVKPTRVDVKGVGLWRAGGCGARKAAPDGAPAARPPVCCGEQCLQATCGARLEGPDGEGVPNICQEVHGAPPDHRLQVPPPYRPSLWLYHLTPGPGPYDTTALSNSTTLTPELKSPSRLFIIVYELFKN
eukprot:2074891-Pyramimonas_sp.AAC.1